jgi:hypothetical protein
MNWIGIDVGITGAMAVIHRFECTQRIDRVEIFDVPFLTTDRVRRGKKIKVKVYDAYKMGELIRPFCSCKTPSDLVHATIEHVGVLPGEGVVSAFGFGVGFGIWKGLLGGFQIDNEEVHPAVWKRALNLSSDKIESLELARSLYPQVAGQLKRKKDHNRAEALLLAYYGLTRSSERGTPTK